MNVSPVSRKGLLNVNQVVLALIKMRVDTASLWNPQACGFLWVLLLSPTPVSPVALASSPLLLDAACVRVSGPLLLPVLLIL